MKQTQTGLETAPWVILGAGRMGQALFRAFLSAGQESVLWSRRPPADQSRPSKDDEGPEAWVVGGLPVDAIQKAPVIFLTVSDDALGGMAARLSSEAPPSEGAILLHTSGVVSSSVLAPLRDHGAFVGSLHPLRPVAGSPQGRLFEGIACGIEGDPQAFSFASTLVQDLGGRPFSLQGIDKPLYHAAAVLASNFPLALIDIACRWLRTSGLTSDPLGLLLPLVEAMVQNLQKHGLPHALTGPLSRADQKTIEAHLSSIKQKTPADQPLYRALAVAALPLAQALRHAQGLPDEPLTRIADLLAKDPP